jgi:acyl carrier protein
MNEQDILSHINGIFIDILKRNNLNIELSTSAADVDGWDSLTHMILIDKIESHFKIKFKLKEIMKFNNIGDMVLTIQQKLNP